MDLRNTANKAVVPPATADDVSSSNCRNTVVGVPIGTAVGDHGGAPVLLFDFLLLKNRSGNSVMSRARRRCVLHRRLLIVVRSSE